MVVHQVDERFSEPSLGLRIDARDRLVEHEEVGLARERSRDERPLLLSAGKLVHRAMGELRQPDGFEGVKRRRSVVLAERAPPSSAREPARRDDLLDRRGNLRAEDRTLRHVPEAPSLPQAPRRDAEQPNLALPGSQRPQQDLEEGGFPGAVRSDERDELSRAHAEADAIEDGRPRVRERDATRLQQGRDVGPARELTVRNSQGPPRASRGSRASANHSRRPQRPLPPSTLRACGARRSARPPRPRASRRPSERPGLP